MIKLISITTLAFLLSGCFTNYQPPGEDIYLGVKHLEQQQRQEQK